MRTPDRPGTFRIVPRDGTFMLTGVRTDGRRLKVPGLSRSEADEMAGRLFPRVVNASIPKIQTTTVETAPAQQFDDWGVPIQSVPQKVTASPSTTSTQQAAPTPEKVAETKRLVEEKKAREKRTQSLMELVGVGWAAGDVMLARRLTSAADKEPVKPNPKQVSDLADSAKDTLQSWFGDREIKPWQMTILLTLAIPLAMLIQSPKKKHPELEGEKSGNLKSVP